MNDRVQKYLVIAINCAIHGYFIFGEDGIVSDGRTRHDLLPIVGLLVLALLISIPYAKRFQGSWGDGLWILAKVALLFYLSWLPLIVFIDSPDWEFALFVNAVFSFVFVMLVQTQISKQGKYFQIDKEIPELTGDRLAVCHEVARQAGLTPMAVKVATFGSFNALVQGLRRCIIIVDKRATEALSDKEFRAMIAHECGHIRFGGVFPYLLVGPSLFCVTHIGSLHYGWQPNFFKLFCYWLFISFAVSQTLEILCDRFGRKLVGAESMVQLLVRIHNDIARPIRQLIGSLWFCPFITHPPLGVRNAFLLNDNTRITYRYFGMWFVVGLILFHPIIWPLACVWYGVFTIRYLKVARECTLGLSGNVKKQKPLLRNIFIGCLVALAICLFVLPIFSDSAFAGEAMLVALLAALFLCIVGLIRGWFRTPNQLTELSQKTQKILIEMSAAILEGKAEEALIIAESISPEESKKPWVMVIIATCLIHLDRLEEASAMLDELNEREPDFLPLLNNRAVVEACLGRNKRAADMAARLGQHTGDAVSLTVCGVILWRSGRMQIAQQFLSKALDYKPDYAAAVGFAGLLDLELGLTSPEKAKPQIDHAASLEPQDPLVMLALMVWEVRFGSAENADLYFKAIMDKLEKEQKLGWRHFYEGIQKDLQLKRQHF